MTMEVSEPQVAPPRSNVFSRIAGVLFAPAETFEDIVRRPGILGPILLYVALGFLSSFLITPRLDFESIKQQQIEQLEKRGTKMTESDLEQMQKVSMAGIKVWMWLSPLVMIPVYCLFAGLVWLAFRLFGGEGKYSQAIAVTLYAWVPMAIFSILMAMIILARGTFDPVTAATLVKSNPAFLVDQEAQPVLFTLLSSLDLFTFWCIFLFIVGFAALSKLSRGMSAGIVLTLWGMWVLLKLGWAAITA